MKKWMFLILFFTGFEGFGQNNLAFNKVLTYAVSVSCSTFSASYSGPIYEVPSGKVWKIEKYSGNPKLYIGNGNVIKNSVLVKGITELSSTEFNTGNPIWLNSGDIIQVKMEASGGTLCPSYFFSILEYNLIP